MPKVTIVGNSETGVCNLGLPDCPHSRTGTNSSGSPTVFVNNKPVHRQGDSGSCNCPHDGVYTSANGSSSVFVENKPITRIGDTTTCNNCGQSGSHSTGSNNVFAGG